MLGRVLVLSASAGAGHLRAAEAIEKAIRIRGAATDVQHLDVLKYTNQVFRHFYSKAYIDLVNKAPEILGWLYDYLDDPKKNDDPVRMAFDRLNANPFIRYLRRYQPDVAICTHFLPSGIISSLKGAGKVKVLNSVVVTDFDVHAMWLCPHVGAILRRPGRDEGPPEGAGGRRAADHGLGHPDRSGLRGPQGQAGDAAQARAGGGAIHDPGLGRGIRRRAGRAPDEGPGPAGAPGPGGRGLRPERGAAGRAVRGGQGLPEGLKVAFTLLGFTTEMDELMAAADLFVGKPGGLTTSEALAKGLPMVVINPIPGQEERNSDHLLEEGVAIRCNNLPALAYKIDTLLETPGKLARMAENARDLGKPDAAFTVVDRLMELCKSRAAVAAPGPGRPQVPIRHRARPVGGPTGRPSTDRMRRDISRKPRRVCFERPSISAIGAPGRPRSRRRPLSPNFPPGGHHDAVAISMLAGPGIDVRGPGRGGLRRRDRHGRGAEGIVRIRRRGRRLGPVGPSRSSSRPTRTRRRSIAGGSRRPTARSSPPPARATRTSATATTRSNGSRRTRRPS